jgi:hypothetical protein
VDADIEEAADDRAEQKNANRPKMKRHHRPIFGIKYSVKQSASDRNFELKMNSSALRRVRNKLPHFIQFFVPFVSFC